MILSAHFLVGAAIATKTQNPLLGFLLAYLSHYFFDLLPVWEYDISALSNRQWRKSAGDFLKIFFDILFGFLLVLFFSKNTLIGMLGGFLAMVPDGITLLFILFPKINLLSLHQKIHEKVNWFRYSEINKKIPAWGTILSQILIILAAILFLR